MQKYKKETILSITLRPREKVTFKTFLEAGCSQLRTQGQITPLIGACGKEPLRLNQLYIWRMIPRTRVSAML